MNFKILRDYFIKLGDLLQFITSPFVLFLLYVVISLWGIIYKLLRYNPMRLCLKDKDTFYINSPNRAFDKNFFDRQF